MISRMVRGFARRVATLASASALTSVAVAADPVSLRESIRPGALGRVVMELKADGTLRPSAPAGRDRGKDPSKPLAVRVEARFAFVQRDLEPASGQTSPRALRWTVQAAGARNGEVIPEDSALRPEVRLLVAEPRDGSTFSYSPGGPLTRGELDLVQGPADPLLLPGILPEKSVVVGDRWTVGPDVARSLSGYDALAANGLEVALDALDDATAKLRIHGEVRGAVLGGEGAISCDGSATFDRKDERIVRLDLRRSESRKPGPVEAGLDIKSTLTLERSATTEAPPELNDEVVAALPARAPDAAQLLRFLPVGGGYTFLHDRNWHIFSESPRQAVLRRLDHGEVVAQFNLARGPNAGKGRHQDLNQFRDDIRTALGRAFGKFVAEGDVEGGVESGGYRHKVAVGGRVGEVDVLWLYYLLSNAQGEQLLGTFTLSGAQNRRFADQDVQIIGSLNWTPVPSVPPPSPSPAPAPAPAKP